MLSQKLLSELEEIIKEDYGVELQLQAVAEVADTLVNYFDLLAKIDCRQQAEKHYDNHKQLNQN